MPNSIALAQKYIPILDGIYKRESLTARLLGANALIRFDGANTVKVFKTSLHVLRRECAFCGFFNSVKSIL